MSSPLPHVTILLCTRNGAAHLQGQLDSYVAQTHADWSLWVSDDGSDDATLAILETFRDAQGAAHPVHILKGPQRGAAANFMSLLCHPDLPAGWVAISDQDDVWKPEKLTRGLTRLTDLTGTAPDTPAAYSAQSVHVDNALTPIGASRPPPRPATFANALTQNALSGHSTLLNPAAHALVRRAGVPDGIAFHDWWLYQLMTGAGARIDIDDAQVLFYRQHGDNVLGAHDGRRASAARLAMVMNGQYGRWMAANIAALSQVADLLSDANRARLTLARTGITPGTFGPLAALCYAKAGLHRQTRPASAVFYAAAILGRI